MPDWVDIAGGRAIVVVANRLPVDRIAEPDGSSSWRTSPGGLVTAMEPVVRELGCIWVGWTGGVDERMEPFEHASMRLVPVPLDERDFEGYYEGFSNGALWPLYHDAIVSPHYHRDWWESYERVNRRFAESVAHEAPEGAIVWVHDYQLQLVPRMLRELRPDVIVAFFLHIPFPARRLFAQLPWRREIVAGILGADVVGFQREQDALGFRAAAERYAGALAHGNRLLLDSEQGEPARSVLAQEFPISIDTRVFAELAGSPEIRARAKQIRQELGAPATVMLGVDRLDYTKGIRHRLKVFSELLADGEISPEEAVLVQVASPSRERVAAYRLLREEVETTVSRINGEHGSIGITPVVYLHQSYTREEMAALYLAADVLVVTALRDGMNLVAKEYVACRADELGVLVLSEFAGSSDELRSALLVNPHDIESTKSSFMRAMHMSEREQRRRMRLLRQAVQGNDVHHWAESFLRAAGSAERPDAQGAPGAATGDLAPVLLGGSLRAKLRRIATAAELIVACDFDGTLAPIVDRPEEARILDRAGRALSVLQQAAGVRIAVLTGRSLQSLRATGLEIEGWTVAGSHGAELFEAHAAESVDQPNSTGDAEPLTEQEASRLDALSRRMSRLFAGEQGVHIEAKPFGLAVHTRRVRDEERSEDLLEAAARVGAQAGFSVREGKRVRECSLRAADKGSALRSIRGKMPAAHVLFIGDDVTDEDAFASLEIDDLGIKVGPGETAADERVPDPESAAAVLAALAELRTGVVIGTEAE